MVQDVLNITFLALVVAGWVFWAAAWACTRAFFSRRASRCAQEKAATPFRPRVSILKPVKGVDAQAYENFASFCKQDFEGYEILFAVADERDPAVALVHRLQEAFPAVPVRLLVAPKLGANPKCANLHRLAAEATGEVLVISDGDIRVTSDYLARVVAPLADQSVGMVTCPYRGLFPQSLAARLEALHMEAVFLPAVMLAHRMGQRVGMGATMALRRDDLARAGGFAAIADHLMDDYQLAALIEGLGLRTCVSDYVVGSVLGKTRFRDQWAREVRWARGIRITHPGKYFGLLFTYPTAWALALCLTGGLRPWIAVVLGVTLLLRWIVAWDVRRCLADPLAGRSPGSCAIEEIQPSVTRAALLLVPLRDLLSFVVWCAGAVGNRITWRGALFKLRRDGRLESETARQKSDLFGRAVRRLDAFLRHRQGIFEYSDAADCVLRVSLGVCDQTVQLADGTHLSPGDVVCDIHLFNDHLPSMGPQGADLAWAMQMQKALRRSLATLMAAFERDRRFDAVKAIRGQTVLVSRGSSQFQRFARRLHFDAIEPNPPSVWKRMHHIGENILLWAMVRTFNPGGLRSTKFTRKRRWIYMSREALARHYGPGCGPNTPATRTDSSAATVKTTG